MSNTYRVTITHDDVEEVTTNHDTLSDALDAVADYARRAKESFDFPTDAAVIAFESVWWDDTSSVVRMFRLVPRR